ncbi:MAG: FAD:protein FMN transferase [Acidobacteriota bacterium]
MSLKFIIFFSFLTARALLAGVQAGEVIPDPGGRVHVERRAFLMGTTCAIDGWASSRARGLAAIEAAFRATESTEARLSTWRAGTALARLNAAPVETPVPLDRDLMDLLVWLGDRTRETGGAFDPAIGRLVAAWDLRGPGRIPSARELTLARRASGMALFHLTPGAGTAIRRAPGALLDAGGFGKGLALKKAGRSLSGRLDHWLMNFGGQVLVSRGGAGRVVDLADPRHRGRSAGTLRVSGVSVATSSDSERFVRAGGRRLGHILDPRTGKPAPDFGSVTVVSADPLEADVMSTALFVMGPEEGLAFAASRPGLEALFLESVTGGLKARQTPGMPLYHLHLCLLTEP